MEEKQTALVTGGSRGIGRAVCIRLAKEGIDLVINYSSNRDAAEETAAECEKMGIRTLCVQADVDVEKDVDRLFDEAMKLNGRLDILVNNAGITKDNLLMRMKPEDFDRVLQVNLYGTFYCMKKASRIMLRQRYGRIVNMSSVSGLHGNPGQVNYSAAKAGVVGMTKALAKELAAKNVTVNAVAPGMIDTDMMAAVSDAAREKIAAMVPMRRMGRPEDVAEAVAFFASPSAAYITGQVLCVDGGMAI